MVLLSKTAVQVSLPFKILRIEGGDDYAQLLDISGQGCTYVTKKGVEGFQVDFDVSVANRNYHISFQTEYRGDNLKAYSSCGVLASRFGCNADQSSIFEQDHNYSREAEKVISALKPIAEILCERFFDKNCIEED